jgi:pSer/pThr/pTyr-binding forkhead associated (FHA) protein
VRLVDLGSAAGSFVNGQRVDGSRELKAGDKLKVGPLEFEVVIQISLAGTKKPKVSSVEEAAARIAGGAASKADDIDSWLGDEDQQAAPSRYAARLSDEDIAALGQPGADGSKSSRPGQSKGDVPGSNETRDAAQDVLKKYFGRR